MAKIIHQEMTDLPNGIQSVRSEWDDGRVTIERIQWREITSPDGSVMYIAHSVGSWTVGREPFDPPLAGSALK